MKAKGIVVTFEENIDEESLEQVTRFLLMVRGVASVRPVVANFEDLMTEDRAKRALRLKIMDALS